MTCSETEDVFYCGTTSGDILTIGYPGGSFKAIGPEKNKYSLGINAIQWLKSGDILAGSGDGKVYLLTPNTFKPKKFVNLPIQRVFEMINFANIFN